MKTKSLISFIIGLARTGALAFIFGVLYLVFTFDLGGGETLNLIENQKLILLICSIVFLVIYLIRYSNLTRRGQTYLARGLIIMPILSFIFVCGYFIKNYNFHEPLIVSEWKPKKWKPFGMAASLVKEGELIGLTRIEVKEMLGEGADEGIGDVNPNKGFIEYLIEESWTLTLYFENGKVVESRMVLPSMMT